jgi:hypothetical protein
MCGTGVRGKLGRYLPLPQWAVEALEAMLYWSIDDAALTVLKPLVHDVPQGAYLVPIARERRPSAQAGDTALSRALWQASEELVCKALPPRTPGRKGICP